jgi:HSP90 family molecular chaperone
MFFVCVCVRVGSQVLFMTDPIDEYAVQNLAEFDGKKLQSITKENVKFGDEASTDKKREELYSETYKPLVEYLKDTYGSKVEKVTVSSRLSSTPCILTTSQYGYSANMERIMKSQAFADPSRAQHLVSKKTMEINPRHPIIAELLARVSEDKESSTALDTAWLLFDTALLNSGFQMDDPKEFSTRMLHLMQQYVFLAPW